MKTTTKLAVVLAATTMIASQAFAGNWQGREKMAERNAEYFQQSGSKSASDWTPSATDTSHRGQRMGQRNAEYFAGKSATNESQPVSKKETTHPKKR